MTKHDPLKMSRMGFKRVVENIRDQTPFQSVTPGRIARAIPIADSKIRSYLKYTYGLAAELGITSMQAATASDNHNAARALYQSGIVVTAHRVAYLTGQTPRAVQYWMRKNPEFAHRFDVMTTKRWRNMLFAQRVVRQAWHIRSQYGTFTWTSLARSMGYHPVSFMRRIDSHQGLRRYIETWHP